MRAADSSMGDDAGQFQTTRWALVMAYARGSSQSFPLGHYDALIAAKGRLKP